MTLKQLQAEWRPKQADRKYWTGDDHTQNICADALTPFILQQERDIKLIAELADRLGWDDENDNRALIDSEGEALLDKAKALGYSPEDKNG